jgi:hypothetical protein
MFSIMPDKKKLVFSHIPFFSGAVQSSFENVETICKERFGARNWQKPLSDNFFDFKLHCSGLGR